MLEMDTQSYQKDLVICFEVAEHIDPQYADQIVKSVIGCMQPDGLLLWTAAQPGQGGVGHINCRPRQYWVDKFTQSGLIIENNIKEDCLEFCRQGYHMGWFLSNLICFRKPADNPE